MTHIRKHLLFTVAAALLFNAFGIGDVKSNVGTKNIAGLFSLDHKSVEQLSDASISLLMPQVLLMNLSRVISSGESFDNFINPVSSFKAQLNSFKIHTVLIALQIGYNADSPDAGGGLSLGGSPDQTVIERFVNRFQEASFKVKLLVVILIYMIVSVLVLFVSIVINRQLKETQRRKIEDLSAEYQEQLASYLFDEEADRIEIRGINKKLNREIFIDELMDLHNNLHGEAADRLKDLYFNLGLHRDSLRKVYKGRWDKKAKGFKELAQMDVKDANDQINKYVDHKNSIIRMESQVAMVKLSEDNPLGFLDNLKTVLSYWEQVNIYETLNYHQINVDSFEPWMESDNPSVVLFALRMTGLFKHSHSAAKVRELLFSENPEIALEAVKTMGELELADHVGDLKTLYESETLKLSSILKDQRENITDRDVKSLDDLLPRKIRFEVVRAIYPVAEADDIPFLEKVAQDSKNTFKLRILAIQALMSVKPYGEQRLNQILEGNEDELVKKMIINVKQNQES